MRETRWMFLASFVCFFGLANCSKEPKYSDERIEQHCRSTASRLRSTLKMGPDKPDLLLNIIRTHGHGTTAEMSLFSLCAWARTSGEQRRELEDLVKRYQILHDRAQGLRNRDTVSPAKTEPEKKQHAEKWLLLIEKMADTLDEINRTGSSL